MKKKKKVLSTGVFVAALLMGGCSEKKEENDKANEQSRSQTATPKIEVVAGENKIKVEEKKDKQLQSENAQSYYYSYKDKQEPSSSSQHRSSVDAYTHIRSPYERVQISLISKQLSKKFRIRCSPCHDDYANGVIGPSLLGKSADYIYNKIIAFKTGKKDNPLMSELIKPMSEEEIKEIANEIYSFNQLTQQLRKQQ